MSILTKKIEEDGGFYAVFSDKVQLPVGAEIFAELKVGCDYSITLCDGNSDLPVEEI